MKRLTLILLTVITTSGLADPRLWDPQGVTVHRSARIEWPQAVAEVRVEGSMDARMTRGDSWRRQYDYVLTVPIVSA